MTKKEATLLADVVHISRQYQRSIRIDIDLGRTDALNGYICHATATSVIESICKQVTETNQRSFTWTGPFGGGKSSLAIALASTLHRDRSLRTAAREALNLETIASFDAAFPVKNGWLLLPVVGQRGSIIEELSNSLCKSLGKNLYGKNKPTPRALISDLLGAAKKHPDDGVLVIIDEMGKFLEASALGIGDDVYFFQELAEAAARSEGRLVVVGVLHQSFAQYASRLGIETRDDWAKVQGRYLDLPFVAASDEVVELIGRALESKHQPAIALKISETIASSIRSRRPSVGFEFAKSLAACWPLHPTMAALLGPISKRQFGQNERSTFGFLSSVEPFGFCAYLNSTIAEKTASYRPNDYWDYLRANLEPSILASSDGHRWSQAVDAVERTEAKTGDRLLIELIKSIAVIDLFRNGSGLAAAPEVLSSLFYPTPLEEVEEALQKLAGLGVALFKSYIGAWSVFEGSDFNIDAAIAQALASSPAIDYTRLSQLMGLHPIVAKRHYHTTGSMRWMEMMLCSIEQAEKIAANYQPQKGEFGSFILALPTRGMSPQEAQIRAQACSKLKPWPVIVGVPKNHYRIGELSAELVALEQVNERHELTGDRVARREVHARLAATHSSLEEQLQVAASMVQWYSGEEQVAAAGSRLSPLASEFADELFKRCPRAWSELANRENLSSNSVKARRNLLHAMLEAETAEALGFEGFPAERGLYETLLKSTELHRQDESGVWRFLPPDERNAHGFLELWKATRELFSGVDVSIGADKIYDLWSAPDFGVKQGVQPIIFLAFLLSNKANIALYKDGMFLPHLTDADIDECLQAPKRFSVRWVAVDEDKILILEGIAQLLSEIGESADAAPLEAARGLVGMIYNLPAWTRKTHRLSESAKAIRDMLTKATDPHKVLFVDLISLLNVSDGKSYITALRAPLQELAGAYGAMLSSVKEKLFEALDADPIDLAAINERANAVAGVSGDYRQDAFATRLASLDGSHTTLEGLLSLAVEKPPREWVDRHIDAANLELAKFARRFREAEAFVGVQGRQAHSEAIALIIGAGSETKTISRSFSIADRHRKTIDSKAAEITSMLEQQGLGTDVLLAILAKAGMKLASLKEEADG
ncbi:TPA: ATP-binding protein [Pseudomonas aeruginosa]|uniref:ATP-binding protein n=1 Tax=Pseudomonas aeruginosa TaxID=287 RepID=UPI001CBB2F8F|nr:ATP-binding protein [Pseudomonas aeruginosa]MCS9379230.1 ATP-binding protein [Pseudomonas aeruginosa]HBP6280112.1 ATP-binding protein [Pseudomonas aeruginosa]HCL4344348.1 ATP-binding protein [Pseudomonas aeruginosa]HEK2085061.1 ATP-binding protein [Pseudomonas aeruginosa]